MIRIVSPRVTKRGRFVKGGVYCSIPYAHWVPPRITKTGRFVKGGMRRYKTIKL